MTQVYKTKDGDVLDAVIHAAYGQCTDSQLRAVLEANPGLAEKGPILPAGLGISLPDSVQESDKNTLQSKGITLWD